MKRRDFVLSGSTVDLQFINLCRPTQQSPNWRPPMPSNLRGCASTNRIAPPEHLLRPLRMLPFGSVEAGKARPQSLLPRDYHAAAGAPLSLPTCLPSPCRSPSRAAAEASRPPGGATARRPAPAAAPPHDRAPVLAASRLCSWPASPQTPCCTASRPRVCRQRASPYNSLLGPIWYLLRRFSIPVFRFHHCLTVLYGARCVNSSFRCSTTENASPTEYLYWVQVNTQILMNIYALLSFCMQLCFPNDFLERHMPISIYFRRNDSACHDVCTQTHFPLWCSQLSLWWVHTDLLRGFVNL